MSALNQQTNNSNIGSLSYQNSTIKGRKTRIEALNDRINIADEFLNSVFGEKLKKSKKSNENNNMIMEKEEKEKDIKQDENPGNQAEKPAEDSVNIKQNEGGSGDNKGNAAESSNAVEVKNPFITRMTKIIKDLKNLQNKTADNDEALDQEIDLLKKRGFIELSLSKIRLKKTHEREQKNFDEKKEYISRLEKQVIEQRIALEKSKKSEGECLLKISTLEDQLRVFKSKVFGFDVPKKYEYIDSRQEPQGPIKQIKTDGLKYSLSNQGTVNVSLSYGDTNNNNNDFNINLNGYDRRKPPSGKRNDFNGPNNYGYANDNLYNNYKYGQSNGGGMNDDLIRSRQPNKNNKINNTGISGAYGGMRYENNKNENEGLNTHMRKITPMILNNNM